MSRSAIRVTQLCALACAVWLPTPAAWAQKPPPQADAERVVRRTLLEFNAAVQAKDFTDFHSRLAAVARRRTTPAGLRDAFRDFIERGINIAAVERSNPVLREAPAVDGQGILTLVGHFPTSPSQVHFNLRLQLERDRWRVVQFTVQVRAAMPTLPGDVELRRLVTETLLEFNRAIQREDFAPFHAELAPRFRAMFTPADMRRAFQSFIDRKINLAPIERLAPTFEPTPEVDSDEFLVVGGSYATQPSVVRFNLKYLPDGGAWRLAFISVKVGEE